MAYVDVSEEPASDDDEANLPAVGEGDGGRVRGHRAVGPHHPAAGALHRGQPRRRSSNDRAIGRPSTYASIINTITNERGYVWKKGNALVPSWTAFAKTQLLERYFGHLVDYGFTATMEEALDEVAAGRAEAEKWLHAFYFGNGHAGLEGARVRGAPREDRHERGQRDPHRRRRRRQRDRRAGLEQRRDAPPRRREVPAPRRPRARRAHRRAGRGAARQGRGRPARARRRSRRPARRCSCSTVASVRSCSSASSPRARRRSRRARRSSRRWIPRRSTLDDGAAAALAARGSSAPTPTAPRSPRRTAATGPYLQEGHRQPQPRVRGAALHGHARGGRGDLRPAEAAPRPADEAADRRARGAAPTPGRRCGCSTAASVPTSPTARRTPPCAGAWTRRRSRSTTRSSCCASARREGPAKKTAKQTAKKPAKKTTKKAAKKTAVEADDQAGREEGARSRRRRRPTADARRRRRLDDAPALTGDDAPDARRAGARRAGPANRLTAVTRTRRRSFPRRPRSTRSRPRRGGSSGRARSSSSGSPRCFSSLGDWVGLLRDPRHRRPGSRTTPRPRSASSIAVAHGAGLLPRHARRGDRRPLRPAQGDGVLRPRSRRR